MSMQGDAAIYVPFADDRYRSVEGMASVMIGRQLETHRRRLGLSVADIASRAGLDDSIIDAFEHGNRVPDSRELIALADVFDVRVVDLFDSLACRVEAVTMRDGRRVTDQVAAVIELASLDRLKKHQGIRQVLGNQGDARRTPSGAPYRISSLADAEGAAVAVRLAWGLGTRPLGDVVDLLEDHGILVVQGPFEVDAFVLDATLPDGESAHVVGINAGHTYERRRFSLAHELAHTVMDCRDGVDVERAADRFAAAFLLPEEAVRRHVVERTAAEVLTLKATYGASVQAIVQRCTDLSLLDAGARRRIFRETKGSGQPVAPADPVFASRRHERLCTEAFESGLISWSRAHELLGRPPARIAARVA